MLLAHVLGCERLRLYMEAQRPAARDELDRFRGLVKRALRHEPVAYLTGEAEFFTMTLGVGPAVLIPRPETETLVEHVLQSVRVRASEAQNEAADSGADAENGEAAEPDEAGDESADRGWKRPETPTVRGAAGGPLRLADVGTGSGAIALAVARHLPGARVVATDVSAEALAVVAANAARLGLDDRVEFREGDLLAPLGEDRFDWLLSNPPYIPDHEWPDVEPGVADHEPTGALRGGADGLDLLRPLIAGARGVLVPGGGAAFELAAVHAPEALALARAAGWLNAAVLPDHERRPRVLTGRMP